MSQDSSLIFWIIGWMIAAATTLFLRARSARREVGLVWAYMANLWLLHWPAAVIYSLPSYRGFDSTSVTLGFIQSTYGLIAFGFGAAVLAPILAEVIAPARPGNRPPDALLPRSYLFIGIVSYALAIPLASRIPTLGALMTAATQLVIVGICLSCWHGWFTKNKRLFWGSLAVAATLPIITVLGQGFLGYGAAAVIVILCFNGSFIRPRWKVAVAAVAIAYFGFSGFVTYMRDRGEIRRVVWGGSTLTDRFTSVLGTVRQTELFDPRDASHLQRIDMRLNQNYLVGASVEMISSGAREVARGETVIAALVSFVPRALWPDKPAYAGSAGIVSHYTGISFASGTSVGVGQVMEFYVNFGTIGVFGGFILLGALIGLFDAWAAERLWAGDWLQFALWFLSGIGFLQAGGSLVEVISTVAAGLLAVTLVNRFVVPMIHRWRADAAYSATASPAGRRV